MVPAAAAAAASCIQCFELYETESKFYMFGTNNEKTSWRLLKIDRLEPSELNIDEVSTTYTQSECLGLLKDIDAGNKSTGGLKFVMNCYGIIGFIKFLGPYYMLVITEQRQIGTIFGHPVYQVTNTEMIELANSEMRSDLLTAKDEKRYKKLLCTIDLRKDFFFSHSYSIMRSLQKNFVDPQEGWTLYDTMFVWNEFLTRGIRNHLKSTLWTVALVYGFFRQDKLSISGKDIMLTLIARRSRHYAGTRYLKRGVNEKGRVANDVETEQIVFEDIAGPTQISSVVQNRGSIPLFWSQETSKLNIRPDIILHDRDKNYEATRLHFKNLRKRYGNPIIILNLIKKREGKPRESILRHEFDKAIKIINKDLSGENHLRFLHWDLHKNSKSKSTNVLTVLLKVAFQALNLTDFFYSQVASSPRAEMPPSWPSHMKNGGCPFSCDDNSNSDNTDGTDILGDISQEDISGSSDTSGNGIAEVENSEIFVLKTPKFQKGVLRTNCIDCLDRTNVAQYAYGLAALGHQLHALGSLETPEVDLDAPLAHCLMHFYEKMGDTLAIQYGGSAAHNKIFSARRGHMKFAIQSQEFFRTLQRHYSNAYMDANKQEAINLFLGYFQPQQGKPALWELDSVAGEHTHDRLHKDASKFIKRAKSDGNILRESNTSMSGCSGGQNGLLNSALSNAKHELGPRDVQPDSVEEISTSWESEVSQLRCTRIIPHVQYMGDAELDYCDDSGDSNFLDLEWLSSFGNSGDEELGARSYLSRSTAIGSSDTNVSSGNISDVIHAGIKETQASEIQAHELSEHFVHWVIHGDAFWY